jgi:hypothetical protein
MTLSKTLTPITVAAFLSWSAVPAAGHDFWINHGAYKAPTGEHCCGDNDCRALGPEEVKITPRGYVLTNGELVPFAEAQASEDGEYWRCKRFDGSRRCFFAPQPSS